MRITITWEEESKAAKEPTYYHGARVCVEGVLNRRSIFYSFKRAGSCRVTTTDPALMQCDTTNITNRSIGVLVSSCGCEASRGLLRMQKESSFEWTVSTTGIEPAAA